MAANTLTIEERPEAKQQEVIRDRVVIWYHESDFSLVQAVESHIQLLMLRLGKQFRPHYFGYPTVMPKPQSSDEDYQQRYERTVGNLGHCALFIPCISNACMVQMWKDMEHDSRLAALFTEQAFEIRPVLMRPTLTGAGNTAIPLSAHEGYQLDLACQRIAEEIERVLRANVNYKPVEKQAPLATLLLAGPTPVAQEKRRWSLFNKR